MVSLVCHRPQAGQFGLVTIVVSGGDCWTEEKGPGGEPPGPSTLVSNRSAKVEAVEVHDLVPGGHEVVHEILIGVVARIDLGERPELGVGAEDQVDAGAGPLALAGGAVAPGA